jgi:hypothetical protein
MLFILLSSLSSSAAPGIFSDDQSTASRKRTEGYHVPLQESQRLGIPTACSYPGCAGSREARLDGMRLKT